MKSKSLLKGLLMAGALTLSRGAFAAPTLQETPERPLGTVDARTVKGGFTTFVTVERLPEYNLWGEVKAVSVSEAGVMKPVEVTDCKRLYVVGRDNVACSAAMVGQLIRAVGFEPGSQTREVWEVLFFRGELKDGRTAATYSLTTLGFPY